MRLLFMVIITILFAGDKEALREDVLNDPAFQKVWSYLEDKDVPKDYIVNTFLDSGIKIHSKIIDSFNNPYEKKNWDVYRKIFMTDKRLLGGIKFFKENSKLVMQVSDSMRVDPYLLVSLIGIESNYGKHYGQYTVFNALYTLIHQLPRKVKWASRELAEFILLCHGNKIEPHSIYGSYAGAFGFGQFIPSSFNNYAIDFDGDSVRHHDEWPDVLGSIANYLLKNGYKSDNDDYSKGSRNWKSVFAYNHSNNYVGVVMELRQEIKNGIIEN
ncbi:MAG: lytic murein transglycosylase [Candidatus Marinimicrobia bacterium]|nr:lytic murein transglycosylase [Candidatus Neomarinimicrobiota bacterium]